MGFVLKDHHQAEHKNKRKCTHFMLSGKHNKEKTALGLEFV